jgi:hypothetical protein
MPSIKPSLFIGLGTSGAEILGYLQELIVQEYLVEGFPVTRLLSFVTDESDGRLLRHASREQAVYLSIPSTQVVRNEVTNATTRESRALAAWLPREVCLNSTQFRAGASAMRAAGRLLLWRNYALIREKIADNVRACTDPDARRAATQHLSSHLGLDASKVEMMQGLNVYVVGSLCGGTCSGMFLDLGFMLRSLPEITSLGHDNISISGVFTILNRAQAMTGDWELQAANCYAAIKELDFVCHVVGKKPFPIVFPDGDEVFRDHLPYEYIYLLGATSASGIPLVDGDKKFSHKAVLRMIAHSLFLDSYAGTCTIKEGMRTDWRANVSPGDPDQRKRNPRVLFSFGCSMISYPMYSIARATAGLAAKDVCMQWLTGKGGDFQDLVQESRQRLIRDVFSPLTQPEGAPAIAEELKNEIRKAAPVFSLPADVLRVRLMELPDASNPIVKRFQPDGRYYGLIRSQFETVVDPLARKLVRAFVEKCRVKRRCGLPDAFEAIGQLREMLEREMAHIAAGTEAVFEFSRMDPLFARLRAAERDFWLKIMGLRQIAVAEHQEHIRIAFERIALHALDNLAAKARGDAIGAALAELATIEDDLRKEQRLLRELADPDNHGTGYFATQADDITNSLRSPPKNVHSVWAARDGTIDSELALQHSKISAEESEQVAAGAILPSGTRFSAGWTRRIIDSDSSEKLGARVLDALTLTILRKMKNSGVRALDEAMKKWNDLKDVVDYASPYMEFTQEYLEGTGDRLRPPNPRSRNAVFGDATTDEALGTRLQGKLPLLKHQDGDWGYHALQGLSNYLIFYQEEAYFSSTYMAASEGYVKSYRNHRDNHKGGSPVLRWTDQRWHPHGPPIGDLDRAEYIGFLLEHALEVLVGTRVSGDEAEGDITDRLFRWYVEDRRRSYYFDLPCQRGMPERVCVGEENDYIEKARRETAKRFIPYLVDKLSSVVRTLGSTPPESIDKFTKRCMSVKRQLDLGREEGQRSQAWTDLQKSVYEERCAKLDAFFLHVRELAWVDLIPNDQERERLRKFPWLINWAREDY